MKSAILFAGLLIATTASAVEQLYLDRLINTNICHHCNLADADLDLIASAADSPMAENEDGQSFQDELTEILMNNMSGDDLAGVEDGLETSDFAKLAESTARAVLN